MQPNLRVPVDLVTFTEKILNGKLHFFCSGICEELLVVLIDLWKVTTNN